MDTTNHTKHSNTNNQPVDDQHATERIPQITPPNIRTLITSRRPTRDQMDTTMENHRNMQQRIPGYHSSPSDVRPRYQERPTGDAGSTQRNGSQQPTGPREPGKIHDWTTYTQVKNSALTLGPASLALKYYPGLSRDIFPRLLVLLPLIGQPRRSNLRLVLTRSRWRQSCAFLYIPH